MKNSKIKLFIMFLAGIIFSTLAVFAANVTIPTSFNNAVQYLQKLVLTDANNVTGIVLDGEHKKIMSNSICDTSGNNCKLISELTTGVDLNGYLTGGALNGYLTGTSTFLTGEGGKWCIMSGETIDCNQNEPSGGIELADNIIKTNHIKNLNVTEDKIANNAVTTNKIGGSAVTNLKINDYAVSISKIQTGAVTTDKIANNAVSTSKIQTDAITNDKIANDAVKQDQVENGYVTPGTTQTITGLKKIEREVQILRNGYQKYIEFRNLTGNGHTSDNYWYIHNASSDNNFINSGHFSLEFRHNDGGSNPLLSFGYFSGGTNIKSSMGILGYANKDYALNVNGDTRIKGNLKIDAGDVDILGGTFTAKDGEAIFNNVALEVDYSNMSTYDSEIYIDESAIEINESTIEIKSGNNNGKVTISPNSINLTTHNEQSSISLFSTGIEGVGLSTFKLGTQRDPNLLFLKSAGSVGIGTNNPKAKLDVAGGVKIGWHDELCDINSLGIISATDENLYVCLKNTSNTAKWHKFEVSAVSSPEE